MTGQQLYDALVAEMEGLHSKFAVRFKDESLYMRFLAVLVYPFNDRFLTHFTTTMGPKVYFPSRAELARRVGSYARVLAHEWVHIWDDEKHPFRFSIGYAFPQWLALIGLAAYAVLGSWIPLAAVAGGAGVSYLALWLMMKITSSKIARLAVFFLLLTASVASFVVLAIWLSKWWAILAGISLIPLAPWGAHWRAEAEYRGYAMGIAISYWKYGEVADSYLERRVPTFTGMAYYRMDPNKGRVLNYLKAIRESCATGDILRGPDAVPYVRVHEVLRAGGLLKEGSASA